MRRTLRPRPGACEECVTSMSGMGSASDVPVIASASPAGPSGRLARLGRSYRHRRSAVAGWLRWRTTPDRVRGMVVVTVIVAVLLGVITAVIFTGTASGLRLIGQQSEPEVL